jgi:hypothetical protein
MIRLVGWRPERELAMTTPPQCAEEQRLCDEERALLDRIWASLSVVYATCDSERPAALSQRCDSLR